MANKSALVALVAGVRAQFTALGITAHVSLGWRQRAQQINQGPGGANRVVFTPGDGGALSKPSGSVVSQYPRPIAQDAMDVVMSVWAVDTTDTNNEELQIEATETLRELAMRAVNNAVDPATGTPVGVGNVIWGSRWKWSAENTEMYFGREMLLPFVLKTQILDAAYESTTPKAAVTRDPITP